MVSTRVESSEQVRLEGRPEPDFDDAPAAFDDPAEDASLELGLEPQATSKSVAPASGTREPRVENAATSCPNPLRVRVSISAVARNPHATRAR